MPASPKFVTTAANEGGPAVPAHPSLARSLDAMSGASNYHEWIVQELQPFLGASSAEIGAGTGTVTELILRAGVKEVVCFEPSRTSHERLRERLGRDDRVRAVDATLADRAEEFRNRFDSIVYINVLEHIEHDRAELACARAALKPQGHVLIFSPALPALFSDLDRNVGHYRRYTKRGLIETVQAAGFHVVKARYFDVAGILPWYIAFVLLKQSAIPTSVGMYDRFVVPTMRTLEKLVEPPIGKNVLLIGRRIDKH